MRARTFFPSAVLNAPILRVSQAQRLKTAKNPAQMGDVDWWGAGGI